MMKRVGVEDVKKFIGKEVYCLKKDGTVASGKLVKVSGSRILLKPKGKDARTSAIVPLVLFDLLAIGTTPYAYGYPGYGYGGGYPGYGAYGGGYGYGGGGFFW